MKTKTILLLLLILVATTSFSKDRAGGGDSVGGGGDANEIRFNEIRFDLLNWIEKGGARGLKLPSGLSLLEYNKKMSSILFPKKVMVGLTTQNVEVGGVPKTCKGFRSKRDGQLHITCNSKKFRETPARGQYKLVHHEYAGLVGIEKNDGAYSDYSISEQITAYLKLTTVLKLAVKPSKKGNMCSGSWTSSGIVGEDGEQTSILGTFDASFKARNLDKCLSKFVDEIVEENGRLCSICRTKFYYERSNVAVFSGRFKVLKRSRGLKKCVLSYRKKWWKKRIKKSRYSSTATECMDRAIELMRLGQVEKVKFHYTFRAEARVNFQYARIKGVVRK